MSLTSSSSTSATVIILYLSLFLFYLSMLVDAYDPVDRFSIICGSSDSLWDDDRVWTGDTRSSKLVSLQDNDHSVAAQAPSADLLPYIRARLSYYEFTYSFTVTAGPKFVRLFFYPASYPHFDRPSALFSVTCGGFTLLNDFDPSLTVDANPDHDGMGTIFREYIIYVEDGQWLNVTFTPNTSIPNSYAFVNGIEVVSMPTHLYYTASDDPGFTLVGTSDLYSIGNNTALETDYRLRVGGGTITPKDDTGLLRSWDGNDYDYLTLTPSAFHGSLVDYSGTNLNFTIIPEYTAPDELYRAKREMGSNATLNKISNLTWEFPVDAGFYYMLRLHFCELDSNITTQGDRAFFIYIAEQIADDHADVLKWSKQKGVPVYRDFAVFVPGKGNQKKANLSLQLHPPPDIETRYSDPFLNGLEIFKIGDHGTNNLAGPNLDPVQDPYTQPNRDQHSDQALVSQPQPKFAQSSKHSSHTTRTGVVAGVVSGVVFLSVVAFLLLRQRKTKTVKDSNTLSLSLPSYPCRQFTLVEMRTATNSFERTSLLALEGLVTCTKGPSTVVIHPWQLNG